MRLKPTLWFCARKDKVIFISDLNRIKGLLYILVNNFMRFIIQLKFHSNKLEFTYVGNSYSGYWFPEPLLNLRGTIYGIGLGLDSSFEQELVKRGYKFFGFEPENNSYFQSKRQFSDSKTEIYNFGIGTSNSY